MDIDFIKWMCEKAEGFLYEPHSHYGRDVIISPIGNHVGIDFPEWEAILYPLLLQRACENIMTSHPSESIWFISMDCEDVKAYRFYGDGLDRSEDRVFKIEDNIDQAKESALRYIFDKEREG